MDEPTSGSTFTFTIDPDLKLAAMIKALRSGKKLGPTLVEMVEAYVNAPAPEPEQPQPEPVAAPERKTRKG